jgi:hypothetical protein
LSSGTETALERSVADVTRKALDFNQKLSSAVKLEDLSQLNWEDTPKEMQQKMNMLRALASEDAHFLGPFFLPVVLNQGPSRCMVIKETPISLY